LTYLVARTVVSNYFGKLRRTIVRMAFTTVFGGSMQLTTMCRLINDAKTEFGYCTSR
jgi:hypothetical protein